MNGLPINNCALRVIPKNPIDRTDQQAKVMESLLRCQRLGRLRIDSLWSQIDPLRSHIDRRGCDVDRCRRCRWLRQRIPDHTANRAAKKTADERTATAAAGKRRGGQKTENACAS